MANEDRKELLDEANELGLEFAANISTPKLVELIQDKKFPKETKEPTPDVEEAVKKPTAYLSTKQLSELKTANPRQYIREKKRNALRTSVVTITNNDNRENDVTTTAHLSFENIHFSLSKIIPLDIAIELEQALIDIAQSTVINQHKDEIVNGKRTGNKVSVPVKKYVISYAKEQ